MSECGLNHPCSVVLIVDSSTQNCHLVAICQWRLGVYVAVIITELHIINANFLFSGFRGADGKGNSAGERKGIRPHQENFVLEDRLSNLVTSNLG